VAYASEISLTALVPSPKHVAIDIKPVVDDSKPEIPIPSGPKRTATNFALIMEIRIEYTCTPPNNDVALRD
jgi:hypothetical protein